MSALSSTKSFCTKRSNFSPSFCYDDHSDRKSLDELVKKLINSHKDVTPAQNSSPRNSKYKQVLTSTYCLRSSKRNVSFKKKLSTKTEIKKISKGSNNEKVSKGKICKKTKLNSSSTNLPKLNCLSSKSKGKEKATVKDKMEILNNNKQPGKEKRKYKKQSSETFAKYGIRIPSFKDILAYQEKLARDKKCVDSINMKEDTQEFLELNIDEPEVHEDFLDCKYLDLNEINEAYKYNSQYMYEIFHGIRYSARHEKFKKQNYQDHFTVQDLKYNTSTVVFTYDQKQQLLRKLHKQFDKENDDGLPNQYFFKVLLPELCLKIFMDAHKMNRDEANTYLENRPIVVY